MISQARSRVSKFGGEQNIFRGATFLFILYVLIKNFLGTIKFGGNNKNWGEQHPRMPLRGYGHVISPAYKEHISKHFPLAINAV